MQPKVYISYSPANQGSVFALLCLESAGNILGWHIEARSAYFSAAYFMMENYYVADIPTVYRSTEDDVYGPWTIDYPPARGAIRCPVPDNAMHELESLQSKFVEEWLFFEDDPGFDPEIAAYQELGIGIHGVNIKSHRLTRLNKENSNWTYQTPALDINIVKLVKKYWRLCEKVSAP